MDTNEYNGTAIVVVSALFLTLTYISVCLRSFVRIRITRAFSADDWFMLVSQVNFTISCAFILSATHYGLGHHDAYLSQADRIEALKYQTLATISYVSNMMFIKLSIAIFLLRLAVKRRYQWALKASIAVVAIWSTAIFLFSIFQCSPVQAQWDLTITDFHCVSGDSFVAAAYSISVMSIITDWMYALMPIFMIWSVQMSTQKKITVGIILSLGIFASIATLIRLKYLSDLIDTTDILYNGTNAMLWTLIEPGIAITAASLITIRPLLRALHFRGFESTQSDYPSAPGAFESASSDQRRLQRASERRAKLGEVSPLRRSPTSKRRSGGSISRDSKSRRRESMNRSIGGWSGKGGGDLDLEEGVGTGDSGSEQYILGSGITKTLEVVVSNEETHDRIGTAL